MERLVVIGNGMAGQRFLEALIDRAPDACLITVIGAEPEPAYNRVLLSALLADRIVMMTNGPNATIGKIVEVDLPRPRTRKALLEHPDYYAYRQEVLGFLEEFEHGAKPRAEATVSKSAA